jgi:ATP-dependent Zn protease
MQLAERLAYIFSALFADLFPLMLMIFVVMVIWQLFAPNSFGKMFSTEKSKKEKTTPEETPKKAVNVCYGCEEAYEDADIFCGHCGYMVGK